MKTSDVKFSVRRSRFLPSRLFNEIGDLIFQSLVHDFSHEVSYRGIDELVDDSARMRRHPNRGVGGPLLRHSQSYARPLAILARHNGDLVGYLPVADNASNPRKDAIGYIKRQAQLRLTTLPGGEKVGPLPWRWLGLCALSNSAREEIHSVGSSQMNVADGLVALAISAGNTLQRASVYPWASETEWRSSLADAGFERHPEDDAKQKPFGPVNPDFTLEHWTINCGGSALKNIAQKQGAEEILHRANVNL